MFSTVGDTMSRMGGYNDECGNIMSTVGVFTTLGDTMSTLGGYREYTGRIS